jgi:ankyrin repeat protein
MRQSSLGINQSCSNLSCVQIFLHFNNLCQKWRLFVLLAGGQSGDPLNALDVSDLCPIMYCLRLGHDDIADLLLTHPNSKVCSLHANVM